MRSILFWIIAGLLALAGVAEAQAPRYAFLPSERSVSAGDTFTLYGTIINPGQTDWEGCFFQATNFPTRPMPGFSWQRLDENFDTIPGSLNAPIDIAAGDVANFVIGVSPANAFGDFYGRSENFYGDGNVHFIACGAGLNADDASVGYARAQNAFRYTVFRDRNPPDVILVINTPTNDGISVFREDNGVALASVAAINIGGAGNFRFTAEAIAAADVLACRSDENGVCLHPRAPAFDVSLAQNEVAFFSIVLRREEGVRVPLMPSVAQLRVRLTEPAQYAYATASTVVALRDNSGEIREAGLYGIWRGGFGAMLLRLDRDGRYTMGRSRSDEGRFGSILIDDSGNYTLQADGDDWVLTGTTDGFIDDGITAFTARVTSDGRMALNLTETSGSIESDHNLVLADTYLPSTPPGVYFTQSYDLSQSEPSPASVTLSDDGSFTGRWYRGSSSFCTITSTGVSTLALSGHSCSIYAGSYSYRLVAIDVSADESRVLNAALILTGPRKVVIPLYRP